MKHLQKINEFFKLYENSNFKNEKELVDILSKDNDFHKGDVHQAFVNVVYNKWQKHNDWGYDDMLNYIDDKFGDLLTFSVMLGAYNGQVCNGGHLQYFDNGYASSESRGAFGTYENVDIHEDFTRLFKKLELDEKLEHGEEALNIIKKFNGRELTTLMEECPDCGGSGEYECYECGGDGHKQCDECNGEGEIEIDKDEYETCPSCDGDGSHECDDCKGNGYSECEACRGDGETESRELGFEDHFLDNLDNKWYKVNDTVMQEFNDFLKTLTLDGKKVSDLVSISSNTSKYNL
jgi:hypothetical protein